MIKIIKNTLLIPFFLWIIGFGYFIFLINSYPINSEITNIIVVFSKGKARLDKGISLLKAGYAPLLLITGVKEKNQLTNFLKEHRINNDQVLLSFEEYDNTEQYITSVANLVYTHHISSLRIVTSRYDMPTTLLKLKALLPYHTIIIPHPVSIVFNDYFKVFKAYNYYIYYLISKYLK